MPQNTPFLELIILKLMVFLPKVFAAVIGAIFGLMLSGDIGKDGKIVASNLRCPALEEAVKEALAAE